MTAAKGHSLAIAVPNNWQGAADSALRTGYDVGVSWTSCGPYVGDWTHKVTQFYLAPQYADVLTGRVVHSDLDIRAVLSHLIVYENAASYSLSGAVAALLAQMGGYVIEAPPQG
jgi:chromosome condensin MukBEF MukE localization factor